MVQFPLQEHSSREAHQTGSSPLKHHHFREGPLTTQIEIAPLLPLIGHSDSLFLQNTSPSLKLFYLFTCLLSLFSLEYKPCIV